MVARIAPSPISTNVTIGDASPHALTPHQQRQDKQAPPVFPAEQVAQGDGEGRPVAPPPPRPGDAFAAAIISGQLSPRPTTPQELQRRLGAWTPPNSPLRLIDRNA